MYAHGGSGNHGCEAIVRSTAKILKSINTDLHLISTHPKEDRAYGLEEVCQIEQELNDWSKATPDFVRAYLQLKVKHNFIPMDELQYKKTIDLVQDGDIALSIGGDNYCYLDSKKYIMLHNMYLKRKAKTVLWGCSVEPEVVQDPAFAEDLSKYDLITARESLSYKALKEVNSNTIQVCDSAFFLDTVPQELPKGFEKGSCVGINVSPMVIEKETTPGIVVREYEKLIDHILKNTNMNVLLIPHVIWEHGDDRIPLQTLYQKFAATGRIAMVEDASCEVLKGYISQCRFFIGARTHATIAAYSTEVPTLVVGYSVKARGIAQDLFKTEEHYVLPVQQLCEDGQLTKEFQWICDNETVIKSTLRSVVAEMKETTLKTLNQLDIFM